LQVTRKGGFEAIESPDGRWLYYVKRLPTEGVWRIPVEGGEEAPVLDHGRECYWDIAQGGIFLLNPLRKEGPNLEYFGFADGRLSEIARLDKGLEFSYDEPSLAVSFDGKSILYIAGESESDLMLVENFR
jgi:hypothetical protein